MRYLIMECALSYAVALDEEGRFVRVPNLGYEMGQVVEDVVLFGEGEVLEFGARSARRTRGRVGLIAAAACLVVAVVAGGVLWRLPIGTVYMRINPEVSMEVNRLDRVVSLEGENNDGAELIAGFSYYGRTVDEVTDDLAELAEDEGYLDDGGTIEVTVESEDEGWKTATEDRLVVELEVHLDHRVTVTVPGVSDDVMRPEPGDAWDDDVADDAVEGDAETPPPSVPAGDDDDDWDDDWDDDVDDGDDGDDGDWDDDSEDDGDDDGDWDDDDDDD